jgi:hypothetical protein
MESWEALDMAIGKRSKAIAKRLRCSQELVYRWQQPMNDFSQSGAYNPLDRIEAVVSEAQIQGAGDDALLPLHYLARRFNQALIPIPDVKQVNDSTTKQMLECVHEFGELAAVAADALADGKITRRERSEVVREGWQAVEALAAFLHAVEDACPMDRRL